ncbi:hypothetical protein CVS40_8369 [Lucilia cuprina]|nr:hypothetical protein CVS40_8369 [Lucilia cuprina]
MSGGNQTCCLCNEIINECHELFGNNDKSSAVFDIVETYFPKEMLMSKNPLENSIICLKCWNTIADFHEFRRNIYNAHDNFKFKNDYIFQTKSEHITEDFVNAIGGSNEDQIEYKTLTIKDESDINQLFVYHCNR